ncbi:MAG: MraY family glycosyltransferase [Planctomycetota bacterium]
MAWLVALGAILALAFSTALTGLARRLSLAVGFTDDPGHRKIHAQPMPLGGGAAIFLSVWIPVLACAAVALYGFPAWLAPPGSMLARFHADWIAIHVPGFASRMPEMWLLLGASAAILAIGLVDDRFHLTARAKFVCVLAVAAALASSAEGFRSSLFLPEIPARILTILWIVGITNAMNLLDNMDGLSAGVAAIAAGFFLSVALQREQWFLAIFLGILLLSALGFLAWNFPPARIFMGDAGSLFLGFCLAVASIRLTYVPEGDTHALFPVVVPMLILAVPIYDTASVLWIRFRKGTPLFRGDMNHFSHRLLALGLSPREALLVIYLLAFFVGLSALTIYRSTPAESAVLLLQGFGVLAIIALLERAGRRKKEA